MKTMTVAMSALALSGIMTGMLAETADAKGKHLKATRAQVAKACKANGGAGYGFKRNERHPFNGGYGCMTNKAWINCQRNGKCKGGRDRD